MRCFVTGGCGFIGSAAVRQMVETGCDVAVLTLPGESRHRICELGNRVEVIEADLANTAAIESFLRSWAPHACLHCAWYAEPGQYLESVKNIDCMKDSLALLELLIAAGCKRVVMVGTCAEYDTDAGFLKESGAVRPSTLYAAAKLATSMVAAQRAAQAGVQFAWARLFYLFGPGEDERRMVPALIRALLSGREFPATMGDQVRDYLYVEDAAAALVLLTSLGATGIYNVASGDPVTVRRVMQVAAEEIGRPELVRLGAQPYRDWEPPFICGDCSRLRSLGWIRRHDLREGIRQTVDYWRRHG